jgi:cytochrome oxidase Cu insertion factor (SCO1/SenC/PrrC family)
MAADHRRHGSVSPEAWSIGQETAIKVFTFAPDFELNDVHGQAVRLSNFKGKKNVILIFLRGFL